MGLLLLLRSQGVGSGPLSSEKSLRIGKSQSGVSRTLWLIQEMPTDLDIFWITFWYWAILCNLVSYCDSHMVPCEWPELHSPKKPEMLFVTGIPEPSRMRTYEMAWKGWYRPGTSKYITAFCGWLIACEVLHLFFFALGWDCSDGHTLASCPLCAGT
jgi:hypothetical protein